MKRTVLEIETVIDWFNVNNMARFYCDLHSDYVNQFDNGTWNSAPPTPAQINQAAQWFVENHFGVDGRVATSDELAAISSGTIKLSD